jgi:hypothetical protein
MFHPDSMNDVRHGENSFSITDTPSSEYGMKYHRPG